MTASFNRSHRITQRREFEAIYKQGKRIKDDKFRVLFAESPTPFPRLGVSVSKRVGNAVQRNRYKRLIREWFRTHQRELNGIALIVQVQPDVGELQLKDVTESLNRLILTGQRR